MPSPAVYTHIYNLGSSVPTATTVLPAGQANPATLTDNLDGASNDSKAVGDQMTLNFLAQDRGVTLFTLTASDDPIVEVQFGTSSFYYLLSNNGGLQGAQLGTTQARTYTYCFAAGTGIDTPSGPRAVEELCEGDDILTADGRAVPMLWLGRQTLVKRFRGARAQLVRIAAGALGGGLPRRDLLVTGDHGMVLDGLVINAAALVGGAGIDLVPLLRTPDRQTVYHVETARHEVILAEGSPAKALSTMRGARHSTTTPITWRDMEPGGSSRKTRCPGSVPRGRSPGICAVGSAWAGRPDLHDSGKVLPVSGAIGSVVGRKAVGGYPDGTI